MLYAKTEAANGLLIPFHTLEKGAACAREIHRDKPIAVMLHYTACPDLPRRISLERTKALVYRATRKNLVGLRDAAVALGLADGLSVFTGMVPDAVAQAAIAATSPREACAHYYVASCEGGVNGDEWSLPVVEFVSPDRVAHHCGPLTGWWNRHTVGIEVCYPGPAPRKTCKTMEQARRWFWRRKWDFPRPCYPPMRSDPSPCVPLECSDGVKRWFAPIGGAVVNVVVGLVADLCLTYPTIRHLVAHGYVAPSKRIDPDPPLSLRSIAQRVEAIVGHPLAVNALKR